MSFNLPTQANQLETWLRTARDRFNSLEDRSASQSDVTVSLETMTSTGEVSVCITLPLKYSLETKSYDLLTGKHKRWDYAVPLSDILEPTLYPGHLEWDASTGLYVESGQTKWFLWPTSNPGDAVDDLPEASCDLAQPALKSEPWELARKFQAVAERVGGTMSLVSGYVNSKEDIDSGKDTMITLEDRCIPKDFQYKVRPRIKLVGGPGQDFEHPWGKFSDLQQTDGGWRWIGQTIPVTEEISTEASQN
jgi:hypothetical protein